jgi:hypothetical protein
MDGSSCSPALQLEPTEGFAARRPWYADMGIERQSPSTNLAKGSHSSKKKRRVRRRLHFDWIAALDSLRLPWCSMQLLLDFLKDTCRACWEYLSEMIVA